MKLPPSLLLPTTANHLLPVLDGRRTLESFRHPARSTSAPGGTGSTVGFVRCQWIRRDRDMEPSPSGNLAGDRSPRRKLLWRRPKSG